MKNQEKRKSGKNIHFNKTMALIFSIALLVGVVVGVQLWRQETDKVSAHPTSTITLDSGSANQFIVPIDATQLTEPRLLTDPAFSDYLQDDQYVLNSTKIDVKGFSTVNPHQVLRLSVPTSKNRVLALGLVSGWGTGVSYTFSTSYLLLLDDDNNLLDSYQFQGTSLNQMAGGTGTEISDLSALSDGSFNALSQAAFYNIKLNAAETAISSVSVIPRTFIGGAAPTEMSGGYNSIEIGLDENIYYSGHWYEVHEAATWLTNGRAVAIMNKNAVETQRLRFKYARGSTIWGSNATYMRICFLSGTTISPSNEVYTGIVRYANSSGQSYSRMETWDASGNRVQQYSPPVENNDVRALDKISDLSKRYFIVKESTKTEIVSFDSASGSFSVEATFPAGTDFEITRNSDGSYNFIGYARTITGAFSAYSSYIDNDSTFVANADANFNIRSMTGVKTGLNVDLTIETTAVLNNSRYFFSALFDEKNGAAIPTAGTFVDSILATLGTNNYWTSKAAGANRGNQNLLGILELVNDHSPALEAPDDVIFDITATGLTNVSGVNNSYWSVLDNWLITGTRNGTLTDTKSVKVYDVYDLELSLSPQTLPWLYSRLNQNPFNITSSIDWSKFGFDITNAGPQLISYFVADSQNQPSTVSRWINKVTPQTVTEKDYALDAQNFHVPLTSVASDIPDDEAFKELAKTMAWHMDDVHTLHEDGAAGVFDATRVTIDTTQLAALQNASEAKPYPVDVTYDPIGDGSILVVNRVWVFVTTKNTLPNNEAVYTEVTPEDTNGVAYYADDYTIPLRIARTHVVQDVLERGGVKVYDYYDITHETDADCDYDAITGEYNLPTLADANKNASRLDITNMTVITGATGACVVQPDVTYKWLETPTNSYHTQNAVTHGTLDITITADVLLHVRQVIYNDHQDVVVPTEGYLTLVNTTANTMTAIVPSGKETGIPATEPSYDTFAAAIDNLNGNNLLDVLVTVPEYYEYMGYVVTDTNTIHNSSMRTSGTYQYDFTSGIYEKWLTLYLAPKLNSTNLPQPYSWDYKLNEFGDIEVD